MSARPTEETQAPFSIGRNGMLKISAKLFAAIVVAAAGYGGHAYLTMSPAKAAETKVESSAGETLARHESAIVANTGQIALLRQVSDEQRRQFEEYRRQAAADHDLLIEVRSDVKALLKSGR